MKVSDKTLAFDKNLWVQFDGVDVKKSGGEVKLTARDEEAYLKVFNHFGRVLKLYVFEDGKWVDSDNGMPPRPFDESQAGHLPDAPPGTAKKKPAKKSAAKKTKSSVAAKKTGAGLKKTESPAKKAKKPAAGGKSGGKAKTKKS